MIRRSDERAARSSRLTVQQANEVHNRDPACDPAPDRGPHRGGIAPPESSSAESASLDVRHVVASCDLTRTQPPSAESHPPRAFQSGATAPILHDARDGEPFNGRLLNSALLEPMASAHAEPAESQQLRPGVLQRLQDLITRTEATVGLQPIRPVSGQLGGWAQQAPLGDDLDSWVRRSRSQLTESWSNKYDQGCCGLIRAFAELVPLFERLLEFAGTPVWRHPRMIHVSDRGELSVLAESVLLPLDCEESAMFMPPERLLAASDTARAKETEVVYSLAAILWYALTGVPPRPGHDPTEVAHRLLSGEGLQRSRIPSGVPPLVVELLEASLRFDPRERPATLRGLSLALHEALKGRRSWVCARKSSRPPRVRWWLGVLLVGWIGFGLYPAWERLQGERYLIDQLRSSVLSRPFPVLGEDPPWHPVARSVLSRHASAIAEVKRDPEVSLYRGWLLLRCGTPMAALDEFHRLLRHQPLSIAGWVSLGITRLELGEVEGEGEIVHALQRPRQSSRDHFFAGAGYLYLLEFGPARECFGAVAPTDPLYPHALLHKGLAALYAGEEELARQVLVEAHQHGYRHLWWAWYESQLVPNDLARRLLLDNEARFQNSPALLIRAGRRLHELGEPQGLQWLQRGTAELTELGSQDLPGENAPIVRWLPHGRLRWNNRGALFFGPPPLPPQ